uniref:uncharacterized protein LOC120338401 n=1 Tax=Styela clava TaxID=7725 RepID=UPI00193940DC|nr:uncharacterized protein LOC120338401 [Styela clava]
MVGQSMEEYDELQAQYEYEQYVWRRRKVVCFSMFIIVYLALIVTTTTIAGFNRETVTLMGVGLALVFIVVFFCTVAYIHVHNLTCNIFERASICYKRLKSFCQNLKSKVDEKMIWRSTISSETTLDYDEINSNNAGTEFASHQSGKDGEDESTPLLFIRSY